MDNSEAIASATIPVGENAPPVAIPAASVAPQQEAPCPTCGGTPESGEAPTPVYAIGRIEARFSRAAVEKEFAQVRSRASTHGKSDREVFHQVLTERANRYLVRKLCWVMSVQGLETYLLQPTDPTDFDLLVDAVRPRPGPMDLDVVIGQRGPIAPPEMCNGLMLPVVFFDQLYSFDRESLIKAIPEAESEQEIAPAAEQVLDLIMQMTDNAGATDEHRALNYLAMRYPGLYAAVAGQFDRNASLTGVEVRPSALSATRRIVEVILAFTNRNTDVIEKMFTRVDVTEEFPFLVSKMSPYYDR